MRTEEYERETVELKKASTGTVKYMGCTECEALEEHKKLEDGTWKCMWCGAEVIKL